MAIDPGILTDREKTVLRLLAKGFDAKSAARELGLSVHTVNERLRSTRRKLQVTSSREAARLLCERENTKSLVYKEFGVDFNATPKDDRARTKRLYAPIAGGLVAMSLIVLTALLTLSITDTRESGPSPNWSLGETLPEASSKPHNEFRLEGNRLLWNGEEASESHVRSFLSVIKQLDPQPPTILSYGAGVPPERIERVRTLMDGALNCEPATCFEVTQPGKQ
jgi:DNA-binding CsgD family transcriptional regulator